MLKGNRFWCCSLDLKWQNLRNNCGVLIALFLDKDLEQTESKFRYFSKFGDRELVKFNFRNAFHIYPFSENFVTVFHNTFCDDAQIYPPEKWNFSSSKFHNGFFITAFRDAEENFRP